MGTDRAPVRAGSRRKDHTGTLLLYSGKATTAELSTRHALPSYTAGVFSNTVSCSQTLKCKFAKLGTISGTECVSAGKSFDIGRASSKPRSQQARKQCLMILKVVSALLIYKFTPPSPRNIGATDKTYTYKR